MLGQLRIAVSDLLFAGLAPDYVWSLTPAALAAHQLEQRRVEKARMRDQAHIVRAAQHADKRGWKEFTKALEK